MSLYGCAAMFIPATSDPYKKLGWAEELYDKQQRPLPAERLIIESISIFKEKNDQNGLGMAYREYGFFFRSASIEKWHKFYESNGFLDKNASYGTRYNKSIEYFVMAEKIFTKEKKYDILTNIQLNMGFTYYFMGKYDDAIAEYDKSLESYHLNRKMNPDAKVEIPEKGSSYEDYIASCKKYIEDKQNKKTDIKELKPE
jgi:tetratricopeptide (TPR) repeat protein